MRDMDILLIVVACLVVVLAAVLAAGIALEAGTMREADLKRAAEECLLTVQECDEVLGRVMEAPECLEALGVGPLELPELPEEEEEPEWESEAVEKHWI